MAEVHHPPGKLVVDTLQGVVYVLLDMGNRERIEILPFCDERVEGEEGVSHQSVDRQNDGHCFIFEKGAGGLERHICQNLLASVETNRRTSALSAAPFKESSTIIIS